MSIRYHSTVLITEKIEEMKNFYISIMGQKVEFDFGGCVIFHCGLSLWFIKEGYPLANALGVSGLGHTGSSAEMCFETDEFETETEKIKKKDIRIIHDVVEEEWGQWTIRFYDPDGNIVELGESMMCFCRRLKHSGMSVLDITEKTGIPPEKVSEFLSC